MRTLLLYGMVALMMLGTGCGGDKSPPPEQDSAAGKTSINPVEAPKSRTDGGQLQQLPNVWPAMPEDFVVAIVIRPKRASESPLMTKLLADEPEVQSRWEDLGREIGVDLKLIDEMVFLFDRESLHFPRTEIVEDPRFMPALIVRHQPSVKQMISFPPFIFTDSPKERVYEGKRYLAGGQMAAHFLSKTSFIATSEEKLKKILATKGGGSSIATELSRAGAEKDLIVTINLEALRKGVESLTNSPPISQHPELMQIGRDLSRAKSLTFSANLTDKPLVQLSLIGTDDQSAAQLEMDISSLQNLARATLQKQTGPLDESQKIRPIVQALLPLVENMVKNLHVQTSGSQLVFDLETPPAEIPSLLEPLFQLAREHREQQNARMNLLQITISMLGSYSVDSLPPRAIGDSQGKPLLSWRVALLPYIDHRELYEKFHLDEPWDSPHNKSLIAEMPVYYRMPGDPEDGRTRILAVVGKEAAFDSKVPPVSDTDDLPQGRKSSHFEDGEVGTMILIVVGRDKAIPWTKPADFSLDAPNLLAELGTLQEETFWAIMRDGPRRLPSNIDEKTLRALGTIAGGERIDPAIALNDEEFAKGIEEENARPRVSLAVARKLESLGAGVKIDDQRGIHSVELPEDQPVDDALPLLKDIPTLRSLSLSGCQIAPESFAHLADLKNLESLTANHCGFTDEATKYLSGLTSLVHVNLAGNPITDTALIVFEKAENLESLDLAYTKVTGRGFKHLPQNGKLSRISLDETPLIDDEMVHLGKIRSLQVLILTDAGIGDSGLAHLALLPDLKNIVLTRTRITDEGLKHLGKIKSLESLFLYDSHIKGNGLIHLVELPQLRALNLGKAPLEGNEAIKHIAKMSNLKSLILSECDIKDAHVSQLAALKELTSLGLDGTEITDQSMGVLVKFSKLDTLFVAGTKVSPQAIEKFSKAKPDCFVSK